MALSAVEDALGLGAVKVDTAYAGMDAVVDVISEMKSKVVVATEDGVDRDKVQAEIDQLRDQLQSIVTSASFSGENWLSTDGDENASVVASATRDASGGFSVKKVVVDLGDIALFTTHPTAYYRPIRCLTQPTGRTTALRTSQLPLTHTILPGRLRSPTEMSPNSTFKTGRFLYGDRHEGRL
jgi:flagellin-like hook-associated protein FlgL